MTSSSAFVSLVDRLDRLEAAFGPTQAQQSLYRHPGASDRFQPGASVKESLNKLLLELARLEKSSPAISELLARHQGASISR